MKATRLYTASQVKELDRRAIEGAGIPGITLMKRAAAATVAVMQEEFSGLRRCLVLCGTGNNAGDGYLVGGLLADKGIEVRIVMLGRVPEAATDAGMAHAYALNSSAECISGNDTVANDIDMVQEAAQADVIVDALLGIGLSGEVRPSYQAAIEVINASCKPIVAVDIPSGLSADTGAVQGKAQGACVKATHTVTFVGRKLGLYTSDGPEYCGQVHFSSLNIPEAIYTDLETDLETATVDLLELNSLQAQLKPRHRNTHKRAQGHLLVIGGNEGMGGAALLAAEAALYAGAGLVSVATHSSNVGAILARRPELMPKPIARTKDMQALLDQATALVIGPGLGADNWAKSLFKT
ncbi:MAG: NAD(P)H-hydrate epimerase, partial [Pseudomonadales bacterium]